MCEGLASTWQTRSRGWVMSGEAGSLNDKGGRREGEVTFEGRRGVRGGDMSRAGDILRPGDRPFKHAA